MRGARDSNSGHLRPSQNGRLSIKDAARLLCKYPNVVSDTQLIKESRSERGEKLRAAMLVSLLTARPAKRFREQFRIGELHGRLVSPLPA